jgi:hypothetical protein
MKAEYAGYQQDMQELILKKTEESAYPKKNRRVLLASLPRSSIGQNRIAGLKN